MMKIPFVCCLFVFTVFSTAYSSEQPYWHKASTLIQEGNYPAAYDEVQELLKTRPDDILLLRVKGVCLLEIGNPDEAIRVLRHAITLEPESIACKYYLGQALAYRGSILEAISTLQAIITSEPDSDYSQLARDILPSLEQLASSTAAVEDLRRWSIYGSISAEYDDNVPLRAKSVIDDSPTDSMRMVYSLYGEVRFPDQKIDNSPITVGAGYTLNGSEYERSSFKNYELFSQGIGLFVSHNNTLWDRYFSVRLDGNYTDTQLGGDQYSKIAGIKLGVYYQWYDIAATEFIGSWDNREYENDTLWPHWYSLDGDEYRVGLRNYLYLMDNSLIFGLHYFYRLREADGAQSTLRSNDATFSVSKSLPFDFRLTGQVVFNQEDYHEYLPVGRLDNIWTFNTALEKSFGDNLTMSLYYTYATADSDVEYSDYRHNVVGLTFSANY